uniref:Keratin n=1 Tax=Chelonoidis abingdonii TaxID=106734 RepID=A0A8C0JGB8_CHEAB
MSFYGDPARSRCYPPCEGTCQQPVANVCNEPWIRSGGDSRGVDYVPLVVVIFPGPILSTSPQHSLVGSIFPALPYGAEGSSGGGVLGGSIGYGDGLYQPHKSIGPAAWW